MLPLEDLTGRSEAADKITHIFFTEFVRSGVCDVAEMGESENAVRKHRIRSTGSLDYEQIDELGETLGVRFLMTGTVLEAGTIRTEQGSVPALGVTLKLIDVASKKVIWADVANRTGDDSETVFGWGREHSAEQLAIDTAQDMFKSLAELAPPPSKDKDGGES
jgi:TolB-like protein